MKLLGASKTQFLKKNGVCRYNVFWEAAEHFIFCLRRKQALHYLDELLRFKGFADVSVGA